MRIQEIKEGTQNGKNQQDLMEYDRENAAAVAPKERIKNFNEFHTPLSKEKQRVQAARCMNCGVPFCQAGMNIMGMTSGVRCIIWYRSE